MADTDSNQHAESVRAKGNVEGLRFAYARVIERIKELKQESCLPAFTTYTEGWNDALNVLWDWIEDDRGDRYFNEYLDASEGAADEGQ